MPQRRHHAPAFTIVELLVVIGILALLMGLLLPALSGAQKRSLKSRELNHLRSVGMAWNLYATGHQDMLVPGFIEPDVQQNWKVSYDFPDKTQIPPAPTFNASDPNTAGPWTFRLAPYVDFNHETLHGYADEPDFDIVNMSQPLEAREVAYNPSFGYNGLYVGGWWEMVGPRPRHRFFDAQVDTNGDGTADALKPVVVRSLATIRRSSDLIIFASSAPLPPGIYRDFENNQEGWHLVTPPFVADEPQWRSAGAGNGGGNVGTSLQMSSNRVSEGSLDPSTLEVLSTDEGFAAAPIGRYNRLVATLYADGRTDGNQPGSLLDMRAWIDQADRPDYRHE